MKTNLLFILAALFLFTSCASFTGFQTGRTSGKGNMVLTGSINMQGDRPEINTESTRLNRGRAILEIHTQHGIGENTDIGLKLSTAGIFSVDVKQQIVGGKDRKFALSTGLAFGSSLFVALYSQVPLYLSFHPQKNLAFYVNPRLTTYNYNVFGANDFTFYRSGSAGVLFGERIKVGIDLSYSQIPIDFGLNSDADIFSIGLGVKVPLIDKR